MGKGERIQKYPQKEPKLQEQAAVKRNKTTTLKPSEREDNMSYGWENEIPVKKVAPVFPQSMQSTTHQIIHQIIIWSNIAEDITN